MRRRTGKIAIWPRVQYILWQSLSCYLIQIIYIKQNHFFFAFCPFATIFHKVEVRVNSNLLLGIYEWCYLSNHIFSLPHQNISVALKTTYIKTQRKCSFIFFYFVCFGLLAINFFGTSYISNVWVWINKTLIWVPFFFGVYG